jgi:hypothetical protein
MNSVQVKKMIASGFVAGLALSLLSYGGLFVAVQIPFLAPFFVEYLSSVFISDQSRDVFFYSHAMLISFALSFFWEKFKSSFSGSMLLRGVEFGIVYTITGLFPSLWLTYSQIEVSATMVLSWLIFGLFQASVAGIIFAKMNP